MFRSTFLWYNSIEKIVLEIINLSAYELNFEDVQQWLLEYKTTSNLQTKNQLKNLIVVTCLSLVKRIAKGLGRRSTDPVEDIIQVGSLGLIKAIDFYKPEMHTNFKSYATYFITGEIKHYIRDKVAMIKPSREMQELAYRIATLTKQLTEALGEEPTNEQLAQALELPIKKVQEVIEVDRRKTISLDQFINDSDENGMTYSDKLAEENYQDSLNLQEDKIMLKAALESLPMLQRQVIEMSYFEDMTQKSIGEKLNMSQIQVSRTIKKALDELFTNITKNKRSSEV